MSYHAQTSSNLNAVTLGQGVMLIGAILIATGMLSVLYVDKKQAEKWIAAGLLTLVAGTGIALIGYALTVAGIVAISWRWVKA